MSNNYPLAGILLLLIVLHIDIMPLPLLVADQQRMYSDSCHEQGRGLLVGNNNGGLAGCFLHSS